MKSRRSSLSVGLWGASWLANTSGFATVGISSAVSASDDSGAES
jgi:hypothetical protein